MGNLDCRALINYLKDMHENRRKPNFELIKEYVKDSPLTLEAQVVKFGSPLTFSAKNGYLDIVRELLELGANINAIDRFNGWTAFSIACERGHVELAKFLKEKKAHMQTVDRYGQSPLVASCGLDNVEIIQFLIDSGFSPNGSEFDEYTPLTKASRVGATEAIKVLVANGADIEKKNIHKQTPLMCACIRKGMDDVKEYGSRYPTIELLIQLGAEVTQKNFDFFKLVQIHPLSGKTLGLLKDAMKTCLLQKNINKLSGCNIFSY